MHYVHVENRNKLQNIFYYIPKRGTYKVRNEIETKRNETKRNQRKRNEAKRNETKSTKTKRNETKSTKRNEINEMKTK
jgi:hypothetical protein